MERGGTGVQRKEFGVCVHSFFFVGERVSLQPDNNKKIKNCVVVIKFWLLLVYTKLALFQIFHKTVILVKSKLCIMFYFTKVLPGKLVT